MDETRKCIRTKYALKHLKKKIFFLNNKKKNDKEMIIIKRNESLFSWFIVNFIDNKIKIIKFLIIIKKAFLKLTFDNTIKFSFWVKKTTKLNKEIITSASRNA